MKLLTSARLGAAVALAAGVAAGFAIVGTAAAAPAHQAGTSATAAKTAVVTVTHHFALAASAFVPDGIHSAAVDYFNQWDPAALSNQDSGRCFNTGLQLPTGITLKSVTAYYTNGDSVMFFEVSHQNLVTHEAQTVVSFDSAVNSGSPVYTSTTEAVPAADALVNMKTSGYTVGVCPSGTTTFSGLVITYTQQIAK